MGRLDGKVAVITAGGSGIGAAAAHLFAGEGARIVVTDVYEPGVVAVGADITRDGGRAVAYQADATSPDAVEQMIAVAESEFGGLDIIFNNADAGHRKGFASIEDMSADDFADEMMGELLPAFLGTKYAIPAFRRRGGGAIVNTGSNAGVVADIGLMTHDVGKAAVIHLTRSTAVTYAREGIRANALLPGATMTTGGRVLFARDDVSAELCAAIPMGRIGSADEQAHAAVFLASDESSYITGAALSVDGGLLAFSGVRTDWREVHFGSRTKGTT